MAWKDVITALPRCSSQHRVASGLSDDGNNRGRPLDGARLEGLTLLVLVPDPNARVFGVGQSRARRISNRGKLCSHATLSSKGLGDKRGQ